MAKVTAWEPGRRLILEWRPATWKADEQVNVELRFDAISDGTRITFEVRGWGGVFSEDVEDLAGWFGSGLLAPLFYAISPDGLGNWLTDRRVRRPTGPRARAIYADPIFHWPNFLLILDRISLKADDNLLEVGCGGGAFMRKALESGGRATAVDHSPEMVRLTIEQNRMAVAHGVLTVLEAEADRLPVADETFTCAVMTGVIGFLPDPVGALKEIRRALQPGGRIAVFGGTAALKGTPAAPEPFASRIRFFEKAEFEQIGHQAGFVDVQVDEPDLEGYARTAKVPEEAIELFQGGGGALLLTGRKA
ncbi:MAG: methyltransferase domain-containing protein [Thermoplasmata archaeon]|nr:methyltransferase domain-containing protein [Thermoplasmata archaeon]